MTLPNPVFLLFAALSLAALAPLIWTLWRATSLRGRRDSALALHRAQLTELDRELEEGRIGAAEHAGARLEVQRRLLAVADTVEKPPTRSGRLGLVLALILVPLAAESLYLINGHPELPDTTPQKIDSSAADQDADKLIDTLRERLATMDPKDDMTAQGYLLLGNAEANRGRVAQAVEAWRKALAVNFDPTLAAQTAEGEYQISGHMTAATHALFQQALDRAPPDAPWKSLAEQRLTEAVK